MKTTVKIVLSTLVAAAAMNSTMLMGKEVHVGPTGYATWGEAYNNTSSNLWRPDTIIIDENRGHVGYVSGETIGRKVIIGSGSVLGVQRNLLKIDKSFTIKAGASFNVAPHDNYPNPYTHIDGGQLYIGEAGASSRATMNFDTNSVAVLYDGWLEANNADIIVGDLGFTGNATINDSGVTVNGTVAFGKEDTITRPDLFGDWYTQSMKNTRMTVKGHSLRKSAGADQGKYYGIEGTFLHKLTMTNSSITVDDGVEGTVAEAVTIKNLTMKSGSALTVEAGTAVKVKDTFNLEDSTLKVGTLTIEASGNVTVSGTSSLNASASLVIDGGVFTDNSAVAIGANESGASTNVGARMELKNNATFTAGKLVNNGKVDVMDSSFTVVGDLELSNEMFIGGTSSVNIGSMNGTYALRVKDGTTLLDSTIGAMNPKNFAEVRAYGDLTIAGNVTIGTAGNLDSNVNLHSKHAGTLTVNEGKMLKVNGMLEWNGDIKGAGKIDLVYGAVHNGTIATDITWGYGYLYGDVTLDGASLAVTASSDSEGIRIGNVLSADFVLKNNASVCAENARVEINGSSSLKLESGTSLFAKNIANSGTLTVEAGAALSAGVITGSGDVYLAGTVKVLESLKAGDLTIVQGAELNIGAATKSGVALMAVVSAIEFDTLTIIATNVKVGDEIKLSDVVSGTGADELWQVLEAKGDKAEFTIVDSGTNKEFTAIYDKNGGMVIVIPEPSMFGLMAGLGALVLVGTRRRRK